MVPVETLIGTHKRTYEDLADEGPYFQAFEKCIPKAVPLTRSRTRGGGLRHEDERIDEEGSSRHSRFGALTETLQNSLGQ